MSDAATAAAQATTTAASEAPAQATATPEATPATSAAQATGAQAEAQPGASAGNPDPKPAEAQKPVVPERYDLKLPDGSLLDKAQIDKVAALAKERGLSNEDAQKVLEERHSLVTEFVEAQRAEFKQRSDAWVAELKNDKEIGGERFNENVELAKRVVDRWADPDLKQALDQSGFGNYPALVRLFAKIGRAMSEDKILMPGTQAGTKVSREELFYGGTKS